MIKKKEDVVYRGDWPIWKWIWNLAAPLKVKNVFYEKCFIKGYLFQNGILDWIMLKHPFVMYVNFFLILINMSKGQWFEEEGNDLKKKITGVFRNIFEICIEG